MAMKKKFFSLNSETGSHFNHHKWKIGKIMRVKAGKCEKKFFLHLILGIL
jgi:hypothetical protein